MFGWGQPEASAENNVDIDALYSLQEAYSVISGAEQTEDQHLAAQSVKCSRCGVLLPFDPRAIDQHSQRCFSASVVGGSSGSTAPAKVARQHAGDNAGYVQSFDIGRGDSSEDVPTDLSPIGCLDDIDPSQQQHFSGIRQWLSETRDSIKDKVLRTQPCLFPPGPLSPLPKGKDGTRDPRSISSSYDQDLETLGIARCSRCGIRLPLDADIVDRHSDECCGRMLSLDDFLEDTGKSEMKGGNVSTTMPVAAREAEDASIETEGLSRRDTENCKSDHSMGKEEPAPAG